MIARSTLIRLASDKLEDARLLIAHGRWSNSYYLYGYAVEITLKAIISRAFQADEIPDKRFVDNVYTHDLQKLVGLAGLSSDLDQRRGEAAFASRWAVVLRWNEGARYRIIDEGVAREMADAVDEPDRGVIAWLAPRLPSAT